MGGKKEGRERRRRRRRLLGKGWKERERERRRGEREGKRGGEWNGSKGYEVGIVRQRCSGKEGEEGVNKRERSKEGRGMER